MYIMGHDVLSEGRLEGDSTNGSKVRNSRHGSHLSLLLQLW